MFVQADKKEVSSKKTKLDKTKPQNE